MSFSSDVKKQITKNIAKNGPKDSCCVWAETCGLLLFSQLLGVESRTYRTELSCVAHRIAELTAAQLGLIIEVQQPLSGAKEGRMYSVSIPEGSQRQRAVNSAISFIKGEGQYLDISEGYTESVEHELYSKLALCAADKDCCKRAFLRGAFLSGGTIAAPDKAYSLEFSCKGKQLSEVLVGILKTLDIKSSVTVRRGAYYVYLRESGSIETLLAAMGAGDAYYELVNVKILREMRNRANRCANCDGANIRKTVSAAAEQVAAIKLISEHQGLGKLPQELREMASLRLEHPELSLRELGAMLSQPLSRSGVNHRMQRLMEIAKEYKKNIDTKC